METVLKGIGLLLVFGALVVIIACGPLFTIWSLNRLFGLQIAYNFGNWVAVVWLMMMLNAVRYVKKDQ